MRQKGQRPQAASRGRYFGTDPGGGRAWRRGARSGWRSAVAGTDPPRLWPFESSVCRFRVWPQWVAPMGVRHVWLDAANRVTASRGFRLRRPAQTLDRRTHIRLALGLPPP